VSSPTNEYPLDGAAIAKVKRRFGARLGNLATGEELAEAWIAAVTQQALDLNLSAGPVPSTISGMRADLLMQVSRKLERLITEREAEVVLRLTPASARAVHRLMKAIYEDLLEEYILKWTLEGASLDKKRGSYMGVKEGHRVSFASKDAADAAVLELRRRGIPVERKTDEPKYRHLLYVGTQIEISRFNLPEFRS
jgi:hypothetical protein